MTLKWPNAGDNPAPAISGAEGGGLAVHGDYSIAAYPTFILIDPEWNIVEQDIWPMSVDILDEVLQSYGLEQMTCVSSVEQEAAVSLLAWPNPANDALQVEAAPGTQLTLIDLLGREVMAIRATHNRTTLDLSQTPEGSYLLRANSASASETRKVIVRH